MKLSEIAVLLILMESFGTQQCLIHTVYASGQKHNSVPVQVHLITYQRVQKSEPKVLKDSHFSDVRDDNDARRNNRISQSDDIYGVTSPALHWSVRFKRLHESLILHHKDSILDDNSKLDQSFRLDPKITSVSLRTAGNNGVNLDGTYEEKKFDYGIKAGYSNSKLKTLFDSALLQGPHGRLDGKVRKNVKYGESNQYKNISFDPSFMEKLSSGQSKTKNWTRWGPEIVKATQHSHDVTLEEHGPNYSDRHVSNSENMSTGEGNPSSDLALELKHKHVVLPHSSDLSSTRGHTTSDIDYVIWSNLFRSCCHGNSQVIRPQKDIHRYESSTDDSDTGHSIVGHTPTDVPDMHTKSTMPTSIDGPHADTSRFRARDASHTYRDMSERDIPPSLLHRSEKSTSDTPPTISHRSKRSTSDWVFWGSHPEESGPDEGIKENKPQVVNMAFLIPIHFLNPWAEIYPAKPFTLEKIEPAIYTALNKVRY